MKSCLAVEILDAGSASKTPESFVPLTIFKTATYDCYNLYYNITTSVLIANKVQYPDKHPKHLYLSERNLYFRYAFFSFWGQICVRVFDMQNPIFIITFFSCFFGLDDIFTLQYQTTSKFRYTFSPDKPISIS